MGIEDIETLHALLIPWPSPWEERKERVTAGGEGGGLPGVEVPALRPYGCCRWWAPMETQTV